MVLLREMGLRDGENLLTRGGQVIVYYARVLDLFLQSIQVQRFDCAHLFVFLFPLFLGSSLALRSRCNYRLFRGLSGSGLGSSHVSSRWNKVLGLGTTVLADGGHAFRRSSHFPRPIRGSRIVRQVPVIGTKGEKCENESGNTCSTENRCLKQIVHESKMEAVICGQKYL